MIAQTMSKQRDKPQPQDLDAEQAVLGAAMTDCDAAETVLWAISEPRDFYREAHQQIFRAMQAVHKRGEHIDPVTVAAELRRIDVLENVGGATYLQLALPNECPTTHPSRVKRYAKTVMEKSRLREVIRLASSADQQARNNPVSATPLINSLQNTLDDLRQRGPVKIPDHASAKEMGDVVGRQEWLWHKWLPKGHITLMLSRQGVGKSALALHLQLVVAGGLRWPDGQEPEGTPGHSVHLEAEGFQGGHAQRLRDWGIPDEIQERIIMLGEGGLDTANLHDHRQLDAVQALVRKYDAELVVIDALRRALKGDENESRVSEILSPWQDLARQEDVSLLLLHHMGKGYKGDREPVLDDLRGSSAIGDICRSAIGLWNPDPMRPEAVTATQLKPSLISAEEAETARFSYEWGSAGLDFDIPEPEAPVEVTTQKDQAKQIILDMVSQKPQRRVDILQEAEAFGISRSTLDRAAGELRGRQIQTKYEDGQAMWGLIDTHHEG